MNFRLIALASCVALGSIALGGKAQAQSVGTTAVPFGGTVLSRCIFVNPVAGVLVRNGSLTAVEASAGVTGLGSAVGNAGSVILNCTGAATVTVGVPTPVSVPTGFVSTVLQSVVQRGNNTGAANYASANTGGAFDTGSWTTLSSTPSMTVPIGSNTLNVGMVAGTNSTTTGVLPAGTYSYNVTLTATPQ